MQADALPSEPPEKPIPTELHQTEIKIAGRNIDNLRYHHSNGQKRRETKEPLNEGESEKAGLKLNIQKAKIMASGLITSWQIDGETLA